MFKRFLKFILKLTFLILFLILAFITAVNYDTFGHIHTQKELLEFKHETASLILSDNNTVIGKVYSQNRTNTKYNKIPKHLINALIATEDARYFSHTGVDTKSLLRVLFKTILQNNKRSGGGSTITQQLAKNMYGRKNFGPLTMLVNKTKEAIQAYRIEQTFSKEEILTLYLNTVSFGENIYGIEAAALRYFNVDVNQLNIEQSAVLIGILKANTYYNPRLYPNHALTRRKVVFKQMEKYNYISAKEQDSLNKLPLTLNYNDLSTQNKAGYFIANIKTEASNIIKNYNATHNTQWDIEKDGLNIKTTLDIELQNYAIDAFKSHLSKKQQQLNASYKKTHLKKELHTIITNQLKKNNSYNRKFEKSNQLIFDWKQNYIDSISVIDSLKNETLLLHAGLIAINPKNGAIKAWVGGIGYDTHPYDQIYAQRQLASTFKPIVYAAAIENGTKPCEYLDNDPISIKDYNNWKPENANKKTGGKYSLTGALSNSMNIPTVNLYLKTGFKAVDEIWQKMNFSSPLQDTPSLALGTANTSLYELAFAYTAFANNGYRVSPKFITSISTSDGKLLYAAPDSKKHAVIESNTAKIINSILQKAVNNGTGNAIRNQYNITMPLAGKTGTSQNYSDAWFIGYNPNIVITSRVGANSPSLCPTIFSVTRTGTKTFPLCTAIVSPTIIGIIIDARDHVLITDFFLDSLDLRTFVTSL